ncbi:hypothetical protein AMTR_s00073p00155710 [Amborella trichopoda]|uniref:Component of oligomeric Golgi complex 3 n=1 Tax=Amborella trichopoda TaxID=13333 RepID=W1NNI5_AMBTC|nr:hypothetical protein AMTR_s00073p00155710 [Amborella trichopoda]
MVSTVDEDTYLREMAPWIEEWRSRAARVIGEEEEEGISLSQYEDRYRALLRDIATLTEHGEGVMRELRTAYLNEARASTDEISSLRVECDSAVEEQNSIAEDFEQLCQNFERIVAESDSFRDELERNSARDECHELKEDVKGLLDRCGRLSRLLLAAGGKPSLLDVNPYVRVLLPSFVQSQSQSRASSQMMRGPR